MHEVKDLTDEKKKEIYELYRKMMMINRESIVISLQTDDEKTAKYISDFYVSWIDIKKQLISIVTLMKNSWIDEKTSSDVLEYFG